MPDDQWYLSVLGSARLVRVDPNILYDPDALGMYADLATNEERETLEFLRGHPWREGLRARLANRPWLRDIITDPRRPAALLRLALPVAARVLDVGAGWGQLSLPLARVGHRVCALDQTPARLRILRAIAGQEGVEVAALCGDIETFPLREGAFDLVILNGVLEWTIRDRDPRVDAGAHQAAVLRRCRALLAPAGRIFLAIENALGLKYLMGSRDDHSGTPWVGVAEDPGSERLWRAAGADRMRARTHDLTGYRRLFGAAALTELETWACFPDYKLPDHVVPLGEVDGFLAGAAEWTEHHGDNGAALPAEWPWRDAYRRFARLGCGHAIAPSYAFALGSAPAPASDAGPRAALR